MAEATGSYADLEIRILDRQEQGYPVEITLNGEQEYPRGFLAADVLPWVGGASAAEDGRRLFALLTGGSEIKTAWAEARGRCPQRRIRLRIDTTEPALHTLPWELLIDDAAGDVAQEVAASAATPFSRYLAGRQQPGSPILKRPARILVVIANPQNLAEYDLPSVEVETEWAALQAATHDAQVELVQLPQPCTLAAIEAELAQGYHALHFVGHGQYSERQATAVLLLADAKNQVQRAAAEEIAAMLARRLSGDALNDDKLRLVFLASCQTATRSPADAFRGVAPRLVQAGVPAVVAMQDLVPVQTARDFAATFYRRLLTHGQVDLACNEARAALLAARLPGAATPVLFMRLPSGQLLGKPGRITSSKEDAFWPFLLENINLGQCTPFLGPRVNTGLLLSPGGAAERLADKYDYPLPDRQNLARVAQYIAIADPEVLREDYLRMLQRSLFTHLGLRLTEEDKRRYRTTGLSETITALEWAEKAQALHEDEIHHLLADLELPLYMTTNVDSFMAEALRHRGKTPRQLGPRWEQPEAGTPEWVLLPEPSAEQPVVFHLNGFDADPDQRNRVILAEDDYLAQFVHLSRDRSCFLPAAIVTMLSAHSYLFLGYDLDDWEFRSVLQGLVRGIAGTNRAKKLHIGVQLEPEQVANPDKARAYLGRYLGQLNIDIYWGTSQQFVTELHTRWQQYLGTSDDDWNR